MRLENVFLLPSSSTEGGINVKVGGMWQCARLQPGERKRVGGATASMEWRVSAPEILSRSAEGYDFKVDMWSLGIMLFSCITGTYAFDPDGILCDSQVRCHRCTAR